MFVFHCYQPDILLMLLIMSNRSVSLFFKVNSEEPVYEAVMKWVKSDSDERRLWLPSLLQHVRLPLLSARYITDVVDNE